MVTRLGRSGFQVVKPRVFEANSTYDDERSGLRTTGRLLRLREVGGQVVLTFKGPVSTSKHKSREELETTVGNAMVASAILERLGLLPGFRYEKYRTEFHRPGEPGLVTLDETPVGWFLELEGTPDWIDRTASELGFSEADYITESYGSLYLNHCRDYGITPSHMVFS
jgi:adenylate cyclase, class 2